MASLLSASMSGAEGEAPYTPRIVKIQAESEVDSLENLGVDILRRRGDLLLCFFPSEPTRSVAPPKRKSRHIAPTLDIARTYYDVGSIQTGAAAGTPYTGKGVVVGLCDIGIDPLHPTFLDADGRSRIKRVVQYVEGEGKRIQLDGDDEYMVWQTDDPEMYHATHVCGILAGGGAGTPYAGMAPDAEIVATVSTLTDVGLLAGVEDIIEYAEEQGNPAVINISVGSYTGAHDGSSLFSQYLDMCGDDAVIVLSAGNEGGSTNTIISAFTPERGEVAFRLDNTAWDNVNMYGATEIWSGSSAPLTLSLGVYDSNVRQVVRWLDPFVLADGETRSFALSLEESGPESLPFEGELIVEGGVDPENGRYVARLSYEYHSEERSINGGWARYEIAVKAEGRQGDDVEVYADGTYTRLAQVSGSPAPASERSISDLACGFNVISVGMYGNRDSAPRSNPEDPADATVYWASTGFEAGATVGYSSFGTLRDGRVMPLTVAPGATLVSSESRIYHELHPEHPHIRIDGNPWLDESGTSMSSPYVAGCIATWLEAVPTLTSADVRRILAATNRIDIPDPDDPHNATGYFDPVAGLKLALSMAGVESVDTPVDGLSPAEEVEVYDMAGVKKYAGPASGLSGIGKGIYVVRAADGSRRKIAN